MYSGQSHLYALARLASDQLVHRSQDGPDTVGPSLGVLCRTVEVIDANRTRAGGPPGDLMNALRRALVGLSTGPVTLARAAAVRTLVHRLFETDRADAPDGRHARDQAAAFD